MVTRDEILVASGAELDAIGEKLGGQALHRSTKHVTDFNGKGSVGYTVPKSDKEYRAELLAVFDSMKDGGPAFGTFHKAGNCAVRQGGMTLRDYFAAKAMQAGISTLRSGEDFDEDEFARTSYNVADAMLRERAK